MPATEHRRFSLFTTPARSSAPHLPLPRLLGHLREFRSHPLELLQRAQKNHGDIVYLDLAGITAHGVFGADGVQHVLQKGARNYQKETPAYQVLRLLLGNGLVTSNGDFWLRQRRIAQPAFQRKKIDAYDTIMQRVAEDVEAEWRAAAVAGTPIDVHASMMRLTLRIAGLTLMSTDINDTEAGSVGEALSWLIEDLNDRIANPLALPLHIPMPRNRRFVRYRDQLDAIVLRIIGERRKMSREEAPQDLLTMFLHTVDEETGEQMNDVQLRDEMMTMFLAGHETTANLLAWCWHALAQNPQTTERLVEELDRELGGRAAAAAELSRLPFTHNVLLETMRLYPPVWLMGRSPIEDDEFGGHVFPRDTIVFVAPWVTHRHPEYWPEAERFDPDRFTPAVAEQRPKYAYVPFAAGPRQCIGNHLAMVEAMITLAWLAPRFSLQHVDAGAVVREPVITLRPKGGLWMRVRERDESGPHLAWRNRPR
jgi:cytochrome P450